MKSIVSTSIGCARSLKSVFMREPPSVCVATLPVAESEEMTKGKSSTTVSPVAVVAEPFAAGRAGDGAGATRARSTSTGTRAQVKASGRRTWEERSFMTGRRGGQPGQARPGVGGSSMKPHQPNE